MSKWFEGGFNEKPFDSSKYQSAPPGTGSLYTHLIEQAKIPKPSPAPFQGMQAVVNFDPEATRQTVARRLVASGVNEAAAYAGAARKTNTAELQNIQTLQALASLLARYRAGVGQQADSIQTTDDISAILGGIS